jgi:iron complex outermembrane recepter protein
MDECLGAGMLIRRLPCPFMVGLMAIAQFGPADAAPPTAGTVQIRAGPLGQALGQLTRQTGVELLYDQRIVEGARAPDVRGTMGAGEALARLLAGTGVGYRRTPQGVFVLFALPRAAAQSVQEPPVPEILVVGVRTQNADIRRTRNDIQPYLVSTGSDIENAHPDNIGAFFRERLTVDASPTTTAQDTGGGNIGLVNSVINLRGLGSVRTLVLVDGQRMPSLPTTQFDFGQADLNAIPLSAIDRIETLTGTAGGIYGPGAVGGVVNVILRRDYRGADFHLVSGISSRGDARRLGIEGRIGFTPDGGRTDVMVFASRTTVEPLLQGQRDYLERALRRRYANNPSGYIARPALSQAVGVFSQSGGNLIFDPQFGGGDLGSPVTYLPIGFSGSPTERTALLTANAGRVIFEPPPDARGMENYLLSNPTITSAILNVRHRFSSRVQGFIDLLYFRDDGHFEGGLQTTVSTPADSPNNPFQQPVRFTFPNIGFRNGIRTTLDSRRLTLGVIADLGSWKGSANLTLGRVTTGAVNGSSFSGVPFLIALITGTPGPDGKPIVDPLGDWNRLAGTAASLAEHSTTRFTQVNHSGSASIRLAGPLATLQGGPLNLTLLAERRWEHVPETHFESLGDSGFEYPFPIRGQAVASGYGELRAPVVPQDSGGLLRGLELQLAARYDRIRTTLPENSTPNEPTNDKLVSLADDSVTFTAGARIFPLHSLMLRGSLATGQLPPTIEQLSTDQRTLGSTGEFGDPDPRRGDRLLGSEGDVTVSFVGSHNLKAERARTLSIGAVVNPNSTRLPRLSIDYSRIDVRREVRFLSADLGQALANEGQFVGRIVRAPLTDADRALGFTAGRVLSVDLGAFNGGRTLVETVDAHLDWRFTLRERSRLRLYANATWYPTFSIKDSPSSTWRSRLRYTDGPLRWRGNVGAEWTMGPLMIGLNAQYFGPYAPTFFDDFLQSNSTIIANQGSNRIPSQTYIDLTVRRHFALHGMGGLKSIDANVGILNVFDRSPPIITQNLLPGYSYYGDPRRRRFELILSGAF